MTALDRLRTIAEQAGDKRTADGGYRLVDYRMPEPGAFVGEHTGFVVVEPATVLALLDVAEDAQILLDEHDRVEGDPDADMDWRVPLVDGLLRWHLDRLREVTS